MEYGPIGTTHAALWAPPCYLRELPSLHQVCPRLLLALVWSARPLLALCRANHPSSHGVVPHFPCSLQCATRLIPWLATHCSPSCFLVNSNLSVRGNLYNLYLPGFLQCVARLTPWLTLYCLPNCLLVASILCAERDPLLSLTRSSHKTPPSNLRKISSE